MKKQIKFYEENEFEKISLKLNKKNDKYKAQLKSSQETLNEISRDLSKSKKIIRLSNKIIKLEQRIKRVDRDLVKLKEGELEKLNFFQTIVHWFKDIEYENQRKIWGLIFIIPWILGMLFIFLPSFITTVYWSFNIVELSSGGVVNTKFAGLSNYINLLGSHVIEGNRIFTVELLLFAQNLLIDLPIILIFSIIIAVLLNKEFKGHKIVKAIFFIPVIYNMSVISQTMTGSFGQFIDDSMSSRIGFVDQTISFFMSIGIGEGIIEIVLSSVERIFTIVNLSGIQILIFIAAIQSIPTHLYEAAAVEGATKYESFWKITIPMITPIILTAAIYTVIDSFSRAPIFRFLEFAMRDGLYGLGAAISISYFIVNILIVLFIFLLFRGRMFYYDED